MNEKENKELECACGQLVVGKIEDVMYTEYHISTVKELVWHCIKCGHTIIESTLEMIHEFLESKPFSLDLPYNKLALTDNIWLLHRMNRFYLTTSSINIGEEYTELLDISFYDAKGIAKWSPILRMVK